LTYARDTSHLDFVALSEKDFDLTDQNWSDCKAKATAYTTTRFVAFSAFEWGDKRYGVFGHRPVYFPTDDQPLLRSTVAPTYDVSGLIDRLLTTTTGISSAAHPDLNAFPTDWDYFDGASDRTAEIYSRHGFFETGTRGVQQALARGDRFGFVAVSDTRVAQPGSYGLTAVLATSLTKANLHAALKARRTYATTGAHILLRVTAGTHQMGEEYTASTGPTLSVQCTPTSPLLRIEVLKNNQVVYSYVPLSATSTLTDTTSLWRTSEAQPTNASWSSPAFDASTWNATSLTSELEAPRRTVRPLWLRHAFTLHDIPESPILRVGLQGQYRLFLNGRLLVDTHTLRQERPFAGDECNGPDAVDLAGTLERLHQLGCYDLHTLGETLQRGENVIGLEYEPTAPEPEPRLTLESVATATPIAFTWSDNSFTGTSFYYVRVTQSDGHQAWASPIWVDRSAPDVTPPLTPDRLRASRQLNDVYLEWPKVTKDIAGNLEHMGQYQIFRGTTPDFQPDRSGRSNQIATTTSSHYRDVNAVLAGTNYYYRIAAVDAAGNVSPTCSNLAFVLHHNLPFHSGISNIYWLALPYQSLDVTAAALAYDLNAGTSGACTKVMHWNPATQKPESWVYLGGQWIGTNFGLAPGQAVAIMLQRPLDAVLAGAHDPATSIRLTSSTTPGSLNWIGLPAASAYQSAGQLVQALDAGPTPGPVTRIVRFDPELQREQSYQWSGSSWTGTNFTLQPGEGYGVEVNTTIDWLPSTLP
jgi:hypothetical protein